jgi:purine-binding chemotaxis protein CheW
MARTDNSIERRDQSQYLTFMLGRETFAVGILCIKEILEYEAPTDVPMMPAFVRGIVNLRGAVVPVIDLAVRLGRAAAPVTKKTCIVIVETRTNDLAQAFGLLVDAVNEVIEIADSEIAPPPTFGASVRSDFIQGMGKVRDKFVIILNIDAASTTDGVAVQVAALEPLLPEEEEVMVTEHPVQLAGILPALTN